MLGRSVTDRWSGGDPAGVWGDLLGRLRALDGLVVNLECCVSNRGTRWPDKTYYFRADPAFAVPALTAADTSVAVLANNHVLDFQADALQDTRQHLTDVGIAPVGAGQSRRFALDPAITEVGGQTVATVAFTDRRPSYAATEDDAGTAFAPLDPSVASTRSVVSRALSRARAHAPDLLVASLHWGPNWETSPSASQQQFARWLVDQGVDVVHGHSAHVLQGIEVYRGCPIVYDAGDLVDDYIHKEGFQNKHSALFELSLSDGTVTALRVHPVEIRNERATVARRAAAAWVRSALRDRSLQFDTVIERAGRGLLLPIETSPRE
jgi:poly-gamma-glutamate synthesis protein (capsule biosynthesis protein)